MFQGLEGDSCEVCLGMRVGEMARASIPQRQSSMRGGEAMVISHKPCSKLQRAGPAAADVETTASIQCTPDIHR